MAAADFTAAAAAETAQAAQAGLRAVPLPALRPLRTGGGMLPVLFLLFLLRKQPLPDLRRLRGVLYL